MTTIETLKKLQAEEINNGFINGSLWNDLEDAINNIENPSRQLECVRGDIYGSRLLKK